MSPSYFSGSSMPLAKVEVKQGMYKEYSVETKDDSALDQIRNTYKTAEETDDSKTKVYLLVFIIFIAIISPDYPHKSVYIYY